MKTRLRLCALAAFVSSTALLAQATTPGFVYHPDYYIEVSGAADGSSWVGVEYPEYFVFSYDPPGSGPRQWELDEDLSPSPSGPNYLHDAGFVPTSSEAWVRYPPPSMWLEAAHLSGAGYTLNAHSRLIAFDTGHLNMGASLIGVPYTPTEYTHDSWSSHANLHAYVPFWVEEAGYLFVEQAYLSVLSGGSEVEVDPITANADWSVTVEQPYQEYAQDTFDVCIGIFRTCLWTGLCDPDDMLDQREPNIVRDRCIPISAGFHEFRANFESCATCTAQAYLSPIVLDNGVLAAFKFVVVLRYLRNDFQPGDLNDDGSVDGDDLPYFNDAREGEDAFYDAHPDGNWAAGDMNEDGRVDDDDVADMVDLVDPDGEGACCVALTCYADKTLAECDALEGVFWPGASCSPSPCADPRGACCVEGECQELSETQCEGADGIYHGDGTTCDQDCNGNFVSDFCDIDSGYSQDCNANDVPDECDIIREQNPSEDANVNWIPDECETGQSGACCYPGGSCEVTAQVDCTGNWQGESTDCDPNPCPLPGACCYADGSCAITMEEYCSGTWQGESTDCDPNPCPQPGACCEDDGSCAVTLEADCTTGTWHAEWTTCDPNPCPQPGACCHLSACTVTMEADCDTLGGDWQGANTECTETLCLCLADMNCDGSVDFDDINPFVMAIVSRSNYEANYPNCFYLNGDMNCDESVDFDDMNPFVAQIVAGTCGLPCWTPGACCLVDGSCEDEAGDPPQPATRADCAQWGGQFQGADTTCAQVSCPQPGACCLADLSCQLVAQWKCTKLQGHFLGVETTCDECTHGACCYDNGSCSVSTPWNCYGYYLGDDTDCDPNECPQPGACCFEEAYCEEYAEWACQDYGGTFMGESTTCTPNPCE